MSRAHHPHRLAFTAAPARPSGRSAPIARCGIAILVVLATSCSSQARTEGASTSASASSGPTTTAGGGSAADESTADDDSPPTSGPDGSTTPDTTDTDTDTDTTDTDTTGTDTTDTGTDTTDTAGSTPTTASGSATGGTVISPSTGKCSAAPSDEPPATPLPITVTVGGTTRNALIRLPAGSAADTQHPVVFNFHGAGATPNEQYRYGNLNAGADVAGAILVLPKSAGTAWQPRRGDLDFVDALLREVKSRYCVDPSRIYAAGMSSGALMTSWLACTRSDVFAAFATVATALYTERLCADTGPVDLVGFHGTADPLVPFGSGPGIDGIPVGGGAAGQYAAWARHDGCAPTPRQTDVSAEVVKRTWTGCTAGGSITLYAVRGGGHTWPGAVPIPRFGKTTIDIDAGDPIWELFDAHRLGD